ncbi:SCO family protein [Dongia deserti]|uniref:SCO family protein n=1 Tax=Dongia deserti TaxID=2268030 RepID=UPI000E64B380|nr:SCO family protein [Dongia deserti]
MNSVWVRRGLTAVLIAVLAICGVLLHQLYQRTLTGNTAGEALIGGPFELVDQNGNTVTDQTFQGRLMLVYFGFTYCPDACPTALGVMSAALDKLDVAADRVVPILITVDPERDTPAVLKDYVSNFHPGMLGLTGTKDQIAKAAKAYRVFYQKAAGPTPDDYLMDHTLLIYLMDGDGKYITHFGPDATPDQMADEIRKHL